MNKQSVYRKIVIITCCLDDWGGSEELWARAVPLLRRRYAAKIIVYKNKINRTHPEIASLATQGVLFRELNPVFSSLKKLAAKTGNLLKRLADGLHLYSYNWNRQVANVYAYLKTDRPDLVIVSQAINFDGLAYAHQCLRLKIPYITVAQKAVDFFWPQQLDRSYMRETLLHARKCFFVSQQNKRITEEQFGIRLPDSSVIHNPVKVPIGTLPFPSGVPVYRLACVGRLFVIDKGQDILLRILSQEKWKNRPVIVSFIGTGPDQEGLREMAALLNVTNIEFRGHVDNIEMLWKEHHALLLPSRSEGLPLAMIEAMAVGRPVIVTDAGGNAEVIENEVNGFLSACNEKAFDDTMEKAWSMRDQWEAIGNNAMQYVKRTVSVPAEEHFVELIDKSLNE